MGSCQSKKELMSGFSAPKLFDQYRIPDENIAHDAGHYHSEPLDRV